MRQHSDTLPWLAPGQDFPPAAQSWGPDSAAPGLLCAGGDLSVATLQRAYRGGIFPWFNARQPILWWSPDPRMVLAPADFRLHPSLRKTLRQFSHSAACQIRIDSAFEQVIRACASGARPGQSGTWIGATMIDAYIDLHHAGLAHSVETWIDGELAGSLYCVTVGQAVFGESMFHRRTDASKIALAALVGLCLHHQIPQIDCQQNTRHLASLGAREISRAEFLRRVAQLTDRPNPRWTFEPVYWQEVLALPSPSK